MNQFLEQKDLNLHLIGEDYKENFERRTGSAALTSFESYFLKVVGDLLRPKGSEYCWSDNSFYWSVRVYDTNGKPLKDFQYSVWLDKYGNCLCEDHECNRLYRVEF